MPLFSHYSATIPPLFRPCSNVSQFRGLHLAALWGNRRFELAVVRTARLLKLHGRGVAIDAMCRRVVTMEGLWLGVTPRIKPEKGS